MPELPEVETIRRDLQKYLAHKIIQDVVVPDPSALTGIGPSGKPRRKVKIAEFTKNIIGKQISAFHRRGKYLIMEFSEGDSLLIHLRMTGQLLIGQPMGKERIIFYLSGGIPLCFVDRRRFGEIIFSQDWKKEKEIQNLGVEPLNGSFSGNYLKERFRNRICAVHSALLDQKIVAGIGNIYATESLFEAKIKPSRPAGKITLSELEKLVKAIKKVLKRAILHRGYSMATHVDALGKKGRSQIFSLVYGKEGIPCPRCKNLLKRRVISGRGTVYCPTCQK